VGKIMNIVNNVVIVKGKASAKHCTSGHALDSETLLVYKDRKVCEHTVFLRHLLTPDLSTIQIHENFGPIYQPMYQVNFNSSFPLDLNKVQVSRSIFHVPARSNYVFLAELAILCGSDASNVHDEELAEYELEFSDDAPIK
jgi:H/ACA ribonucleoprotein complex non-core subunit NAF1